MRNFKLTIEYDGTGYNGWQIQPRHQRRKGGRVKTIQGVLEDALFNLFSRKIKVISSSRTDSGVHAKNHVANFKVATYLSAQQIKNAVNSVLPQDIVVKKAEDVKPAFNAQRHALGKTYRYVICNQRHASPFIRHYAYHFKQPLDVRIMKREAKVLLGTHDFRAFKSSDGSDRKNCRRTIKRLSIARKDDLIEIEIEANGFLYNMVRNIVGTLIELGRGKFPPGSMKKILKGMDRRKAGPTVPAKGLCLISVKY